MEVIAAKDDKDSTSVKREDTAFTKALVDDVKGLKIGIPRDYFGDGLDPEVKEAVMSAAKVLEEKGAIVEEFDLSLVEYAIPTYYTIAAAEASSNLRDSMVLSMVTGQVSMKAFTICIRRHVQRALDQRLREE